MSTLDGIDKEAAAQALMQACVDRGTFVPPKLRDVELFGIIPEINRDQARAQFADSDTPWILGTIDRGRLTWRNMFHRSKRPAQMDAERRFDGHALFVLDLRTGEEWRLGTGCERWTMARAPWAPSWPHRKGV